MARHALTLLLRHHNALQTRCYLYLKNREDAEDTAQETELRVLKAIKNFRGDSQFRTWLFAIADRQCHDMFRNRHKHIISDHLRVLIEIHETSLKSILLDDESFKHINNALSQLPEKERDAIILRYYRDLSLQDISLTMGLGLSATKMRLYRALDKLSTAMRAETNMTHA